MRRWPLCGSGFLLLASCFLVSCAHLAPSVVRAPAALPTETAAYYAYPPQAINPSYELVREQEGYRVQLVRWPLAMEPPATGDDATIEVEWYASTQPGQRAALLVLPILGGDYPIERSFCRFFAARGLHCALVHRRTIKFTATESPEDFEALLRVAVIKNRQVLDWMETQPGVDATRLGVFGISMGALTGVMTAAVEPRLQALVAGLAGGSLADILCDTRDGMLTQPRDRYLATHAITREELHRRLTAALRTDPLRLAPHVDAARTFVIMARFDRTIRPRYGRQLWEALGRPARAVLPTGHYAALLATPYVQTRALRFYRRALALPPTVLPPQRRWRGPGAHGIMAAP